jgi:alcohol dehydrogenase
MARIFENPVAVYSGGEGVETLAGLLARRAYLLVTSAGWPRRQVPRRIAEAHGAPLAVIDTIQENPALGELMALEPMTNALRGRDMAIVALGGGSVIDAAKAVAVAVAPDGGMGVVEQTVRGTQALPAALSLPSLFCLPTTAGTGSEVTRTATVWDRESGAKYSLADDRLFPTAAILDPALTATAPAALTLATGLDALSHAMEAVWNVNHNPVSDAFATAAIARVKRALPRAVAQPDLVLRGELQHAAMLAGLAISSTRTALAHSISYPLTARFGLRHGLAVSFTLPDVAAYNLATHPERIQLIAEAFGLRAGEELPDALRGWLAALGVYQEVRRHLDVRRVGELGMSIITPGRADNNIRPATAADAHALLYAALDEETWSRALPPPVTGHVIWITGLSGSGKTVLAGAVTSAMQAAGRRVVLLDADDLRAAVSGHVGHSLDERRRLARRYAALCRFLAFEGIDVVCATMSLFGEIHQWNRIHIPHYVEVYLKAERATLVRRDPKGLYRRAALGGVPQVVGIDLPFDEPAAPDVVLDTSEDHSDLRPLVDQVLARLEPLERP